VLVLVVGSVTCGSVLMHWARSGSAANHPQPTVTGSSPLTVRIAAWLASGTWSAVLALGSLVSIVIAALTGIQSLVNFIRIRICDANQGETWEFVGSSRERQRFLIEGANVWNYEWRRLDRPPVAARGRDGELRRVCVYEIAIGARTITFGAEECSAGCAGFFSLGSARPGAR